MYHRGFHGDLNETFFVGDKVDEESRKLVRVTYECLQEAIKIGKLFICLNLKNVLSKLDFIIIFGQVFSIFFNICFKKF